MSLFDNPHSETDTILADTTFLKKLKNLIASFFAGEPDVINPETKNTNTP